jgi:ADP-heptose:LPS heptosyltransferase
MNSILIIRLSALGDVAMTVPVIYSLARRYPDLRITVLTRPFFARLFIDRPTNIELFTVDTKGEYKGICGLMRLIGKLRKQHYTMVADLHDLLRSRIITTVLHLCGSRVATVNKDRRARRRITSPDGDRQPQRSYLLRYADTFATLGYPVDIESAPIITADKNDTPTVGIAPSAGADGTGGKHLIGRWIQCAAVWQQRHGSRNAGIMGTEI